MQRIPFYSLVKENGNQISAREQDLLISCGEIISSVLLSSMLNEEGITGHSLYW